MGYLSLFQGLSLGYEWMASQARPLLQTISSGEHEPWIPQRYGTWVPGAECWPATAVPFTDPVYLGVHTRRPVSMTNGDAFGIHAHGSPISVSRQLHFNGDEENWCMDSFCNSLVFGYNVSCLVIQFSFVNRVCTFDGERFRRGLAVNLVQKLGVYQFSPLYSL